MLTPSQEKLLEQVESLFCVEKMVCIAGSKNSGRSKIAKKYLQKYDPRKVLKLKISDYLPTSAIDIYDLRQSFDNLLQKMKDFEIVQIMDMERAMHVTSCYRFKLSADSMPTWLDFLDQIPIKALILCTDEMAVELSRKHGWYVLAKTTNKDRKFLLEKYATCSEEDKTTALSLSRTVEVGMLRLILKRTQIYTQNKIFNCDDESKRWILTFKKILSKLDSYSLNVEESVVKPDLGIDMLGIEEIIAEITREVLEPIRLNSSAVPICKGILLHGPPGTGKSTVGRWLSGLFEGKVYLAESTGQQTLIDSFNSLLSRAAKNGPSIVFLDDIDSLMDSPHAIRKLLVLLDGINIKGRENVCVIATCMNISCVPDALIRGGRLERCIKFDFPSSSVITSILRNRFNSAIEKLVEESQDRISQPLKRCLSKEALSEMSAAVSGWSPSNIHLVINAVIRAVASDVKIDPVSTFVSEAQKIESHIKTSHQTLVHKNTSELNIYG